MCGMGRWPAACVTTTVQISSAYYRSTVQLASIVAYSHVVLMLWLACAWSWPPALAYLQADLADLERRCQAAELRHQELAAKMPEATRPLLRQIEAMQV